MHGLGYTKGKHALYFFRYKALVTNFGGIVLGIDLLQKKIEKSSSSRSSKNFPRHLSPVFENLPAPKDGPNQMPTLRFGPFSMYMCHFPDGNAQSDFNFATNLGLMVPNPDWHSPLARKTKKEDPKSSTAPLHRSKPNM